MTLKWGSGWLEVEEVEILQTNAAQHRLPHARRRQSARQPAGLAAQREQQSAQNASVRAYGWTSMARHDVLEAVASGKNLKQTADGRRVASALSLREPLALD